MPNLYCTFNILTRFVCWYYLLTSFLHIGYLEKCVTMRVYPKNRFVPLPALTDVWNWALRPQHSDWVFKIRQINFTNVTFRKTVCKNFGPSHLLYFRDPWQGLDSLPSCSTETLLPSLRLSSSSSRAALLLLMQDGWSQKEPLETVQSCSNEGQLQGVAQGCFQVGSMYFQLRTLQPVLVFHHLLALGAEKEEQLLQNWEAACSL